MVELVRISNRSLLARSGLNDANWVLNLVHKTMKNFKRNAAILSVALVLAAASVSQALPTIRITDGINTVTVTDGGVGDTGPGLGLVTYQSGPGTFAGWSVIVSVGTTKPVLGSATAPELDLNWSITREQGAGNGTLTVLFSENGFNLATPGSSITSAGGTLGTSAANSATVRTYYAGNNVELNQANLVTSQTFNGPNPFGQAVAGAGIPADPTVAFTVRLDLVQAGGQITSGDIHMFVNAPEGGSMVTFLGTALLALGAFAARRKA